MNSPKENSSEGRDMFSVNFADYLPDALKRDPKMKTFAAAITEQMLTASANINKVLIYSRIDELPEELIDILAYDMHVDWYDYSYPISVKREILKSSVKVHKKMGTKYAVETAMQAIYKGITVKEWFEYNGAPYTFRIIVDIGNTGLSENTSRQIEEKMKFYKNLRSHCDGIIYKLSSEKAVVKVSAYSAMGSVLRVKAYVKEKVEVAGETKIICGFTEGGFLKVKPKLHSIIKNNRSDIMHCLAGQKMENTITVRKGR